MAVTYVDILAYNDSLDAHNRTICTVLMHTIQTNLPDATSKLWHGQPVWFLNGNPIVGYGKLKDCVRLLFWSGQSFDEKSLFSTGKFKAAEARYTEVDQIHTPDLVRRLGKAKSIQRDYKNVVKRRGVLERV